MAGGGKERRSNKKSNNNHNKTKSSRGKSRTEPKPSSTRIRSSTFVEGGLLSDWQFDSQGRNRNGKSNSGLNSDRAKASASKNGSSRKSSGSAIRYEYHSLDLQKDPESGVQAHMGDNKMDESQPIVLLDSKENEIIAYMDQTTPSKPSHVNYTYEYSSDFVLGDRSHRGLGFDDESEATPSGIKSCTKQMEEQEGECSHLSSSEKEMDAGHGNNSKVDAQVAQQLFSDALSPKKNSGFLSIGGMKLYTQDMSNEETDEDYDGESLGNESSATTDQKEQDGSDASEILSDDDSDIDEEVAEDYLEGIGGEGSVLDTKWLVGQALDELDDDSSSSSSFDETLEKLGGIALQDASSEYGMQKYQSRKKYSGGSKDAWSPALDDLMVVKDPRSVSAKTKHVARFPQSWPLREQKSKYSRKFPGEKKKHRKEMIAVKRRERMLRRGVDLEQINSKLEQLVLDGIDMFAFQPMHHRDCSQVRRVAAIYRLSSGCHGSGKKKFVTVTRTQYTCLPSSSDKLRLEKLIGAGNEDADFAVNEGFNIKALDAGRTRVQKLARESDLKRANSGNIGESSEKSGKKVSYASQPVSFVSSGLVPSETVEVKAMDSEATTETCEHKGLGSTSQFGAFEVHTKGFGSKMMAKMGFVEGGGLGKDGQGVAQPIEVIQRPKSLGLGVNFTNTSSDSERVHHKSSGASDNRIKGFGDKSFGAFEKHTKGFGSKMMAKMGFVQGMGLGKDSQGIVNPLVAARLPKSRGLGANR
ncbi:uncharacterized protein LOC111286700 isoform X2 [Durio zibethinus]|uniref:Uncharacterized protein LOC111286700 isoform X2 n=1 Tax=Durio zibethinus TaxID=66656 RepID=A0A6P5XWY2_DURZI|nr:uncharacterized protein LOC111286700 isoform X2 [Durio zibethinus]